MTIDQLVTCKKPPDFLSSVYKQDKYFDHHELFVRPESVCFGVRRETHSGRTRLAYDNFEYVSVQKTLSSLLNHKAYVDAVMQTHGRKVTGVFQDFADVESFSQHE